MRSSKHIFRRGREQLWPFLAHQSGNNASRGVNNFDHSFRIASEFNGVMNLDSILKSCSNTFGWWPYIRPPSKIMQSSFEPLMTMRNRRYYYMYAEVYSLNFFFLFLLFLLYGLSAWKACISGSRSSIFNSTLKISKKKLFLFYFILLLIITFALNIPKKI